MYILKCKCWSQGGPLLLNVGHLDIRTSELVSWDVHYSTGIITR